MFSSKRFNIIPPHGVVEGSSAFIFPPKLNTKKMLRGVCVRYLIAKLYTSIVYEYAVFIYLVCCFEY